METDKHLVDLGVKDIWAASPGGDDVWSSPPAASSLWTTPNPPQPRPSPISDVISLEELEKGLFSAPSPEISDDNISLPPQSSPSLPPPSQLPPSQSSPSFPPSQSSPSLPPPSQLPPSLIPPSQLPPSLIPPSQSAPSQLSPSHSLMQDPNHMLPIPPTFMGLPPHMLAHPIGRYPFYGRLPFPHRPHPHMLPRFPPGPPPGLGHSPGGQGAGPNYQHRHYNDRNQGDHRQGDHRQGDHRQGDHRQGDHRQGDHRDSFVSSKRSEMLCDLKQDGSGFMNQKEKDWVIKVQLLQLHTTTPSVDDYYYQQYTKKRQSKAEDEEGVVTHTGDTPLTLPPPVDERKEKDCPINFKDSLGKVTYGSISAPRKTIDAGSPSLSGPRQEGGKRHYLLTIEKMFVLVMQLEEMDTSTLGVEKLSLDDNKPGDERTLLIESIFKCTGLDIKCDFKDKTEGEAFCQQILAIKKGKKVIGRCLPYFNDDQSKAMLCCISKSITYLIKKDSTDNLLTTLLPAINGVILLLTFSDIHHHLTFLSHLLSSKYARQKFFFTYVLSFVTRGRDLVTSQPDHVTSQWESLLNNFDDPILLA